MSRSGYGGGRGRQPSCAGAGQSDAGVAAIVKILPGSIGYFELSYAESNLLPYAAIEDQTGAFVPPFPANVAAAAAMKAILTASNFSIVNEPGPQSYPISGYSWLLIYMRQSSAASGAALVQLVDWMTHAGQAIAEANDYVPLPSDVQALASSALQQVVGPSGQRLLG